jgi:CBS domain-containing protein
MAIEDYCRREVATIDIEASCQNAAQRMADENVGCLVVMEEEERVRAVVTDRDLALRVSREGLDPAATPLSRIVDRDVIVVHAKRPVRVALILMRKYAVRRLPVLGDRAELVGLFTWDDAVRLIASELAEAAATIATQTPHLPVPASRALVEIASAGERT